MLAPAVAGAIALAALAAGTLARRARGPLRGALFVAGGAAPWVLLRALGAWSHLRGFDRPALLLLLATLLAAAPCLRLLSDAGSDADPPAHPPRR
jgi:hypothetical protein